MTQAMRGTPVRMAERTFLTGPLRLGYRGDEGRATRLRRRNARSARHHGRSLSLFSCLQAFHY
ncbi:MAG TPA: hypothetical protein VNG12_27685 [Acidimicrobiales bacterium]|nr:hypothetical protein [Acidimicrobiales bacterium]